MKKFIPLSLIAVASLSAMEVELDSIDVESTYITEVAQKAETSADAAEAIASRVPSIDMSRRSAIANDVFIRGQKRDNISVEVDGTKIYGACPNRMDPPTSHILANQIESVEVTEGPYDVETFGVMSGGVKIATKKPTKDFKGALNLGYGSWDYKKVGFTASGGNDFIRLLLTASTESSEQYEDGEGHTMAEQVIYSPTAPATSQYQDAYKNMDAYKKKSLMAKAFVNVAKNQELRLSVTANRSENILYPNSKMDALYDDSNIYSIGYSVKNLSQTYKKLDLQYYYSDVDHPMATNYRLSSLGALPDVKNWLTTQMQGLKLKNNFEFDGIKLLVGLDSSERIWDGHYEKNNLPFVIGGRKSIDNAVTKNTAIFTKIQKKYGAFDITAGLRYDATKITTDDSTLQNNNYNGLNANIITKYSLDDSSKIFLGIGQAKRVPDARELYFRGSLDNVVGTQNLKQTTNREIDLGYEIQSDSFEAKIKTFYSSLSDYIYIKKGVSTSAFENIDAKVYGLEFTSEYYATDDMSIDFSAAYKRGKKDKVLAGQSDTDLADMAPLRTTLGLTYEYAHNSNVRAEVQTSDTWDTIDSDNGEQVIDGWTVLNLKAKHTLSKNIALTLGVNNVFDQTYATSNTYTDLTLLTSGGTSDVMLLNNSGRYLYTNLTYKF